MHNLVIDQKMIDALEEFDITLSITPTKRGIVICVYSALKCETCIIKWGRIMHDYEDPDNFTNTTESLMQKLLDREDAA